MADSTSERDEHSTASELAAWAFCPRAWAWRYRDGVAADDEQLARGRQAHQRHADEVFQRRRLLRWVQLGVLVLLAGLALAWFLVGR